MSNTVYVVKDIVGKKMFTTMKVKWLKNNLVTHEI